MPILSVPDVASAGLITDIDPVLLPPGAWTRIENVRFNNGAAEKFLGHSTITTPTVAPYYLIPITKASTAYWVYPGLAKVYAWDGTNHVNITRQEEAADVDYTGTAANLWTGCAVQGVLVLSNGVDAPQMWVGDDLAALQWDSGETWATKGYTANVMRSYKSFLVAMDWNDGSDSYPQSVYWSNQADPLSVPSDWDFADPANDAGTLTLAATQGNILDGLQLRDQFQIYKEDAIHSMQYTGGAFVMAFRDLSLTTGMLAKRCVQEFFGRHFLVAQDDVIIHDGQQIQSVVDKRTRRSLFSAIDPGYYERTYVARNLAKQEMWVCFVETGETLPSRAAVWNWKDNTWSMRDLPSATFIGFGVTPSTSGVAAWAGDTEAWDSDTSAWSDRTYNPAVQRMIAATSGDLFLLDETTTFDGTGFTSYVEREGLLLDSQATTKMVRGIYPRATGGTMSISIGAKWEANGSYAWEGPYSFTPGTDHVVRCRSTGRFHAIRVQFPSTTAGALHGYDLDFEVVGGR